MDLVLGGDRRAVARPSSVARARGFRCGRGLQTPSVLLGFRGGRSAKQNKHHEQCSVDLLVHDRFRQGEAAPPWLSVSALDLRALRHWRQLGVRAHLSHLQGAGTEGRRLSEGSWRTLACRPPDEQGIRRRSRSASGERRDIAQVPRSQA